MIGSSFEMLRSKEELRGLAPSSAAWTRLLFWFSAGVNSGCWARRFPGLRSIELSLHGVLSAMIAVSGSLPGQVNGTETAALLTESFVSHVTKRDGSTQ